MKLRVRVLLLLIGGRWDLPRLCNLVQRGHRVTRGTVCVRRVPIELLTPAANRKWRPTLPVGVSLIRLGLSAASPPSQRRETLKNDSCYCAAVNHCLRTSLKQTHGDHLHRITHWFEKQKRKISLDVSTYNKNIFSRFFSKILKHLFCIIRSVCDCLFVSFLSCSRVSSQFVFLLSLLKVSQSLAISTFVRGLILLHFFCSLFVCF